MQDTIYVIQRRSDEHYLGLRGWTADVDQARAFFGQQAALRTMGLHPDTVMIRRNTRDA